jgi:hypothetical protein
MLKVVDWVSLALCLGFSFVFSYRAVGVGGVALFWFTAVALWLSVRFRKQERWPRVALAVWLGGYAVLMIAAFVGMNNGFSETIMAVGGTIVANGSIWFLATKENSSNDEA